MSTITLLNHASLLIENGSTRLLIDPWLSGTAFSGSWALEYSNTQAIELAKTATHLWISHPHSDHLHFETMKAINDVNPEITFIGHDNSMIDLRTIASKCTGKKQAEIKDRVAFQLDSKTTLLSVPSMAIDYVLAYLTDDLFLLNVNDSLLDPFLLKRILAKNRTFASRKVDVICVNFSHAHKIYPEDFAGLKEFYINRLLTFLKIFDPQVILPTASFHLYTGELARWQNDLRVRHEDLATLDPRIKAALPGSKLSIRSDQLIIENAHPVLNTESNHKYSEPVPPATIADAIKNFSRKLRHEFFFTFVLPPPLVVSFRDIESKIFQIDFRKGQMIDLPSNATVDMECYSTGFHRALTKLFGFDGFYVAADFKVGPESQSKYRVGRFLFFGCLVDYLITPRNVFKSIFRLARWRFVWARREQLFHFFTRGYRMGGTT